MQHIICEKCAPPEIVSMLSEWHTGKNDVEAFVARTIERAKRANFSLICPTGGYDGPVAALMWLLQARSVPDANREDLISSGYYTETFAGDLINWDGICLSFLFASNELLYRFIAAIPDYYLPEIIAQFDKEQQPRIRNFFLN